MTRGTKNHRRESDDAQTMKVKETINSENKDNMIYLARISASARTKALGSGLIYVS